MAEDKRYQVFVSSTYWDLREERAEVMQALLELDCIPAGMEMFPAADDEQWELIKEVIDDCDYYIVVVAGRYGSLSSTGMSYTEREYDYALEKGVPVLGFVHASPGTIARDMSEKDPALQTKLDEFIKKVKGKPCKFWDDAADLGSKVSRSLVKAMKKRPRPGWVRAGKSGDPAIVERLRARIEELEEQLIEARVAAPPGTEDLASGAEETTIVILYKPSSAGYKTPWEQQEFTATWNEIFGQVGPLMLVEASERLLRARLEGYFNMEGDYSTSIGSASMDRIKVQFVALGLIAPSPRKHAPSDHETYWTLTPYGQTVLMRLRAVRHGQTGDEEETDEEETPTSIPP